MRRAIPTHGDLATNAAMVLAKPSGQNPRELADKIVEALSWDWLESTEIAGPGFINLRLKTRCMACLAFDVLESRRDLWP